MYSIRENGVILAQSEDRDEIMHLWVPGKRLLYWQAPEKPIRRLSPDSLAKRREKMRRKRIERKFPLLAPVLLEQQP